MKCLIFNENFENFKFPEKNHVFFSEIFFSIPKKNNFSELKKKVGHSFDAEKTDLSIGDVFQAIRALVLSEISGKCKKIYGKYTIFALNPLHLIRGSELDSQGQIH